MVLFKWVPGRNFKRLFSNALIIIILAALNTTFLYSLEQDIKFDRISIEEGLSQSSVSCILKDSRGLMWFGTQDGLNRYDGYKFTIYRHNPKNPNSLSNNYIYSLYEDHHGVLWVGTQEGLNRFDREKETFAHYKKDKNPPFKLSGNEVAAICEDHDGVLWIGTSDGGLNKYDPKENRFLAYQHDIYDSTSLISNRISTLYIDSSDTIWIGTQDKGLDRLNKKKGEFIHYQHHANERRSLSNNYVTAIAEDREGCLWIGTLEGLNKLEPKRNTFIHYKYTRRDSRCISHNEIRCIYLDHDNELLIGTGEGLNKFNPADRAFSHWKNDPIDPFSLSNNVVLAIYEDSSHILWIGTDGGGFNKYSPYRNRFAHYQFYPHQPSKGLSGKMVYAIYEDRAGIVWVGTNRGLNRFHRQTNTFRHYRPDPTNPRSLTNDYVFSIFEDRAGVMWIGTWGGGLNQFDRKTGTFTHYLSNPGNNLSLSNDIIRVIYEDQNGLMWIGTEGGGLNQFDRERKIFLHFQAVDQDPGSISNNYIKSICEDPSGVLWIGTKYGLNQLDKQTGNFIRYTVDPNRTNSLSNNEVNAIYAGSSGILWIGTTGGLDKFDPQTGQFTHYGEADGLPNNVIYGILEDHHGHLWISTNKGLSNFDPGQGIFRNYGTKDGLQSNEFNLGAFFKTRSGEMFFGGINGFNLFHPGSIKDNPFIPPVIMTGLKISHQSAMERAAPPLAKSIMETTDIVLSYRDRVITFEFAALDYTSPADNRHAYMMEGLDKKWIDAGNRHFASYTTLPPGEYVFKVKGANSDGIWNETGTWLRISVLPPFWQTWWFLGFALLTLVLLVLLFYQARTRRIRERAKQLEEINETLNREIAERKQAEEKVQKSENRLRTFLETASEGFLEVDHQHIVVDANPEMCAILGRASSDLLGCNFLDFINPPDIQKFLRNMEIRKNGKRSAYNLTLLRPDNALAHCLVKTAPLFDENQNVRGYFAMVTDITEIVQAEEELKQTKNYLDNVFNSLSSMLISVNREGMITQWNTAAENYIGVPTKEAISKKIWDVVPFLKFYQDQLEDVFHSRSSLELYSERVVMRSGESKYLDIIVYPLVYEGLQGCVIRMDDVTEAEKKDRQLLQAQKMETVGNLAGGLAHDFNNVLGGIVGTVSLIKYLMEKEKNISLEKIKNSINTIEKGAHRAVNLVNQLLTLSRKNEPIFASVDLNEALRDVMKICENTIDKSIKLDISYHDGKTMVWADATQIQQVVLNLCINSSHAMTLMRKMDEPQGGTLSVSIHNFYADKHFCVSQPEAVEGNYWILKVKDTGVGIEPKMISKIFDPFFTTKTKTQGTGLGLAMVYNIVKQHRGFIDVYSQLHQGTTFSVYLPRLEEQKHFIHYPLPTETMTRGTGLILVVDDEESLRLTLKEILETCGYSVLLAEDGRQGVRIFKERCNEIKLILLDMAMPNKAGRESYIEMKKIYPPVKVLLISGFKHDRRVQDIIELGVNGFLPKPFTMIELSKKIAEIINDSTI
ncbi:MAG: PAS domain S-box protein [Candidatus Aminicenantes bacterium]|nr:MAG: PAS domain S-box protein [Candidatus Aminicenantes bacterium]